MFDFKVSDPLKNNNLNYYYISDGSSKYLWRSGRIANLGVDDDSISWDEITTHNNSAWWSSKKEAEEFLKNYQINSVQKLRDKNKKLRLKLKAIKAIARGDYKTTEELIAILKGKAAKS